MYGIHCLHSLSRVCSLAHVQIGCLQRRIANHNQVSLISKLRQYLVPVLSGAESFTPAVTHSASCDADAIKRSIGRVVVKWVSIVQLNYCAVEYVYALEGSSPVCLV